MNVFNIIKNNFIRILQNKFYIINIILIIPTMIFIAIYFTGRLEIKANLAVVGANNLPINSNSINVNYINKEPQLSDLVLNKYDAVIKSNDGVYEVITVKSHKFKENIERLLKRESIDNVFSSENRGIGTNILGYLTMFILLQGLMFFTLFYEERDKDISKRILSHPITTINYFLAHAISCFLMVFLPITTIILISINTLNLNTNISNIQFIFIVGILCILGSAFGLFISSLVKSEDNGTLFGSMLLVITTLISGSFFSIDSQGAIGKIGKILPQRKVVDYAIAIENNKTLDHRGLIMIILLSIILFMLAYIINNKKFKNVNF
ncbi:ABC transporter permease [Clostridium argentinense]|uniref:ABC transporter permease n=1 Tax=Clostridium argentinense TaxID=29341 RepID=UPI0013D49D46|nr:ABC transporter permease [Clostridium argentinense]NFF38448.1 ABC transporter permease [Clostridium argentinense]